MGMPPCAVTLGCARAKGNSRGGVAGGMHVARNAGVRGGLTLMYNIVMFIIKANAKNGPHSFRKTRRTAYAIDSLLCLSTTSPWYEGSDLFIVMVVRAAFTPSRIHTH